MGSRYSTASGRFSEEGLPRWRRLRELIESTRARGPKALRGDAAEFVRLYRRASADLSAARSRRLAPDIVEYLNALVSEAHARIYDLPPMRPGAVRRWLGREVPVRVARSWPFVLAAALLFAAAWGASLSAVAARPETARSLVDAGTLSNFREMYRDPPFLGSGDGGSRSAAGAAVSWYIRNNVTVSLLSFALGAFLGLGTIVVLAVNGLFMGAIVGYVSASGYGTAILTFMAAHSILELSGLALAGASGLLLGWTIVRGGPEGRAAALKARTDDILALLTADVMLTVVAAFVEGLLSPMPVSLAIRLAIAGASLAAELLYFCAAPAAIGREAGRS